MKKCGIDSFEKFHHFVVFVGGLGRFMKYAPYLTALNWGAMYDE